MLTAGIDIGTTAVKAVVADDAGRVLASVRVPCALRSPAPDLLEHDAEQAWHRAPVEALESVLKRAGAQRAGGLAGVGLVSMMPSCTAVDTSGTPIAPGLLYGDRRSHMSVAAGHDKSGHDGNVAPGAQEKLAGQGRTVGEPTAGRGEDPLASVNGLGQLAWLTKEAPGAHGYWPAAALASHALAGRAVIDGALALGFGSLLSMGAWSEERLAALDLGASQMPQVGAAGSPIGAIEPYGAVLGVGTVDALGDQIVAGADTPGDVLVVLGGTLIAWLVQSEPREISGYYTVPHSVPGLFLVGGPSNAGALFLDWMRRLLGIDHDGWDGRSGLHPGGVPTWLPYVRGERAPIHDPSLRASLHGLDLTHGSRAVERAGFEASGFVIRQLIEHSGVTARRIVASGGGSQSDGWLSAIADVTGLPVDAVGCAAGAALGAAFLGRVAAGLENGMGNARAWARTGRRLEPDGAWHRAAGQRYALFRELSPSSGGSMERAVESGEGSYGDSQRG